MTLENALASLYDQIAALTREKSVATSDLICAHREIERHKAEIARLSGELAKWKHSHTLVSQGYQRMRPVYEAAKEWRAVIARMPRPSDADVRLALAVDKAEKDPTDAK